MHHSGPFPETQTVYVSNHNSTLDMFVLVALGLPRTRFVGAAGIMSRLMGMPQSLVLGQIALLLLASAGCGA